MKTIKVASPVAGVAAGAGCCAAARAGRRSTATPSARPGRSGCGRYNNEAPAFVQDISAIDVFTRTVPGSSRGRRASRSDRGRGRLELTGADRRAYLHGLLTNDIAALRPGAGCYAALLTPQGRMISDMRVSELRERLLVDLPASTTTASASALPISSSARTSRSRTSAPQSCSGVCMGPAQRKLVASVLDRATEASERTRRCRCQATWSGRFAARPAVVVGSDDFGVAGFELFVDAAVSDQLQQALADAGARRSTPQRRTSRASKPEVRIRPGHGRDDDPARGGHRGSRDQPDQGLLRRTGDHHPRAASRSGARGEAAGRLRSAPQATDSCCRACGSTPAGGKSAV